MKRTQSRISDIQRRIRSIERKSGINSDSPVIILEISKEEARSWEDSPVSALDRYRDRYANVISKIEVEYI